MTPKADLHQLIKSLTKSEKRYFNLFANRHVIGDGNKYLHIFSIVEAQEIYNEKELKAKLKKPATLKNLPAEKVYLKKLILKSLSQFHEAKSIDSVLNDKILQIAILYEKGLYEIGYELIEKSVKLALKYEKFLIHSSLLLWKINYEVKFNKITNVLSDIKRIHELSNSQREYVMAMEGTFELISVSNNMGDIGIKRDPDKLIQKVKDKLGKTKPKSILGLYYYYTTLAFIADLEQNKKGTLDNFGKAVGVFKSNPFYISERPNLYLISENNFIVALIDENRLAEAEIEIGVLSEIKKKNYLSEQLSARAFVIISDSKLIILQKQKNWDGANALEKEIEKGLAIHENYVDPNRKLDIYFSLFHINFNSKNYKKANKWLNTIIRTKNTKDSKTNIICLSMVMQLIVMFESGDQFLFANRLVATKKFITQKTSYLELMLFLDILNLLANKKKSKLINAKLKDLRNQFAQQIEKNISIGKLFQYFDLSTWLDSKMSQ